MIAWTRHFEFASRRSRALAALAAFACAALATSSALLACKKPPIKNDVVVKDAGLALPSTLPTIKHGTPLIPAKYTVIVTPTDISIEGVSVALLPPAERWTYGLDSEYKQGGPNDLLILPISAALSRERNDASAHGLDARVIIDGAIPYRIVTEVLYTLGQNFIATYRLVAPAATGPAEIVVEPPRLSGLQQEFNPGRITLSMIAATDGGSLPDSAYEPSASDLRLPGHAPEKGLALALNLILTSKGISIKARGGNVAPGCADVGAGLAIGKDATGYKFSDLGACLAKLRHTIAEAANERVITISATPDVEYRDVLLATDEAEGAGFTAPMFGVVR